MKIALYGYDTIVGKQVIEELESRSDVAIDEFFPLSPLQGEFDAVRLRGKNHMISCVDDFDFARADVALFLTTRDESERLSGAAREDGCIVIDGSGLFAGMKEQPIILRQLNPYAISDVMRQKLAVIPSAVSSAVAMALSPAHDEWGVRYAVVTALVAASESGETGTQTLAGETAQLLNGLGADPSSFPAQLAFNVLSRMGAQDEKNHSEFEKAVKSEVEALIEPLRDGMSLTCMSVPVFYGHSLSVHLELEEAVDLKDFTAAYESSDNIRIEELMPSEMPEDDEDGDEIGREKSDIIRVTPVSCSELERRVFVSRIRQSSPKGFDFTVVMDNTRLGMAAACADVLSLIAKAGI